MIFSMSAGEKPPMRASSAKRSRIALREDRRGTKKVMVDADQMTRARNPRRRRIKLTMRNQISPTSSVPREGGVRAQRTPPCGNLFSLMEARDHEHTRLRP